ncbi:MAG: ATP-binding protein [Bacteroidales bacterium]|nr:ATP-binding protein [Bacteroidales bacterium]
MLRRKIRDKLIDYLTNGSNKILILDGARQIGKSYIIRHEGRKRFKNYIEIDLIEDKKGDRIFADVRNKEDFYLRLSSVAGDRMAGKEDTLVFLDEIQAYPEMLTLLKFLKQDDRYTYIVSGLLLGIALNETLSKPGGKIEVVKMYPLDFEEFLWANNVGDNVIAHMRECFQQRISLPETLHNQMMNYFKMYLLAGGLPDAVNEFLETRNIVRVRTAQKEVYDLYKGDASQYDREHKLKIERIYELIPSYLENKKKRVRYNEIENKAQARAAQYQDEFAYLIKSGICNEVRAVSNPKFPLRESESKNLLKLYLNDIGLLTMLLYQYNISAIMENWKSINLGTVYELTVCSELSAHGFPLYYYDNKKKGEIEFLVNDFDSLSVVPIEVKSGKDYNQHASLNVFTETPEYHIRYAIVLSNEREVRQTGKVIYLPVYFSMFLRPSTPPEELLIPQ